MDMKSRFYGTRSINFVIVLSLVGEWQLRLQTNVFQRNFLGKYKLEFSMKDGSSYRLNRLMD